MNQSKGQNDPKHHRFKIGAAVFCPTQRRISFDGTDHLLEPRVSNLLVALIEADLPMSRESLLDKIWGTGGSDEALTQAVSKLRRAFGDTIRPYRYIKTLPKQGYQLTAPVTAVFSDAATSHEGRTKPSIKGLMAKATIPSNFYSGFLVGVSAMMLGIVVVIGLARPRSEEIEIECPANASGAECLAMVQLAVGRE